MNHTEIGEDKHDILIFLRKVIDWWKIINIKGEGADIRHNDPFEGTIKDEPRLDAILEFGDMAMAGVQGKHVKQLSKDTAIAICHTCYGLADLCRHLGKFTIDHLEKEFGKLRQGSGGTYFISVQQVIGSLVGSGHQCISCAYLLCNQRSEVFDNLAELEKLLLHETKMPLVYIAGHVTRKDREVTENELLEQTIFYYKKYGKYTDSVDRGGLNVPSDCAS